MEKTINLVADAIKARGLTPLVKSDCLVSVDGTWVGAWVMPPLKKTKKAVFRLGFGDNHQECPADMAVVALADKVCDWLQINGEASRQRSATPLTE